MVHNIIAVHLTQNGKQNSPKKKPLSLTKLQRGKSPNDDIRSFMKFKIKTFLES